MASVFLSYDHADARRAAPIAAALEQAGHAVWWDQRIDAGSEYNAEIELAVERADAVVVLWSERSVRSAWVRDEAAEGRDRGKLVPASIDGAKPPMGFRQYQTIDLSKRKNVDELLRVIGGLALPREPAPSTHRAPAPQTRASAVKWPLLATVAALLVFGAALIGWRMGNRQSAPMVAVMSADTSALGDRMARNLLVKLGSLQSVKTDAMRLVGADSRAERRADFIFETSGSGSPTLTQANLALLEGKDRSIVWSKDFSRGGVAGADIEQQLAYTAGQVLECAIEASGSGRARIDQERLKLFLNGCALFAEKYRTDPKAVVPIFSRITASAPRFEPAWRKLLLAEALFTRTERLLQRFTPGDLPRHIEAARKLNPRMPEIYVAQSVLVPINAYAQRAEPLERAVRLDPDNPDLLLMRAEFNSAVGRMTDVVEDATRAVEINPLSPGLRSHMIADLAYAGHVDTALQELKRAEELWPDSAAIDDARFRINNRYGDPKLALQLLRSGKMRLQAMVSPMVEAFVLARINPTETNIRRALDTARSRLAHDPRAVGDLVQAEVEFHREDELFKELLNWPHPDSLRGLGEVLFRPTFRKFRQDPRFMIIAARDGLVQYWRTSGRWPDFCFEPDLPYDCKKEAARYGT